MIVACNLRPITVYAIIPDDYAAILTTLNMQDELADVAQDAVNKHLAALTEMYDTLKGGTSGNQQRTDEERTIVRRTDERTGRFNPSA